MQSKIVNFIKHEAVLVLSAFAAVISMLFVPPSSKYIDYIDFNVIAILFCLIAVVAGLMKLKLFDMISAKLITKVNSTRILSIILVNCTFFFAMLVTNDVALITLVPLTIGLMNKTSPKTQIFIITMETIAANLGSMLTPIGNPQNLYLFSFYNMSIGDFYLAVLPVGIISYVTIMIIMLLFMSKGEKLNINDMNCKIESKSKALIFIALFLLSVLTVLHIINYLVCLLVVFVTILVTDKTVYKKIDYSLLLTFCAFFIFVGNLSNIEVVKTFLSGIVEDQELLSGVVTSQIISNVPAAIMLSGFTVNAKQLLLGVNIGGLGTLVASLASLISFRIYAKSENARKGKYILVFTLLNIIVLIILLAYSTL